jgi:glycosyltransferase involved in cell wall biosynthesis
MVDRPGAPIRVLLPASGLGVVMRGFETFAIECHAALRRDPRVHATLVRARGKAGEGERRAPTVPRDSRLARALGALARRDGYFAEQMGHALTLLPVIARERPQVVFFSDWALGGALGRLRALTRAGYRLLLCNGAPGPPPYDWTIDHVQQLTPAYYDMAMEAGEPPSRHTLLPLGVALEPELELPAEDERAALRTRLGLPLDRELLLSVAALNVWHKRLDYVIREVAELDPRPHLVMLGQREDETPAVLELASSLLGTGDFTARTAEPGTVRDYYRCADMFVLGSLHEASGRVLLEALGQGLPTLCHDSETTRFVTGPHGLRADFARPGGLKELVEALRADPLSEARRLAQHRLAYEKFGWDSLLPRYVEMIEACASKS